MPDVLFIFFWIVLCFLVAISGNGKRVGYWGVFFLSLILSPLIGLIIGLVSAPIQIYRPKPVDQSEVLKKQASELITNQEYELGMKSLQKALSINPTNIRVMYDMACCYSLQGKLDESLNMLARAVELGYSNFELINTDSDLKNLHESVNFENFKNNNYKLTQVTSTGESSYDKIQKLKDLKDSGAITEDEFQNEKKKLLET